MDLTELVTRYLAHLESERRASPRTVRGYQSDLGGLVRAMTGPLGRQPTVDDVTVEALRRWFATEASRRAAATQQRWLTAVHSCLAFAVREGLCLANAADRLVRPKRPARLPTVLAEAAIEGLLDGPPPPEPFACRTRALLEVLYGAGLRAAELVALDVPDLDLAGRTVRVVGKGNKERLVPLGAQAIEAVTAYLTVRARWRGEDLRGERRPLWVTVYGQRLGATALRRIVSRAGVGGSARLHPHLFRHSAATHLLDHGADLADVQAFLGHASPATTIIYAHVSQARLKRVYLAAHPRARGRGAAT